MPLLCWAFCVVRLLLRRIPVGDNLIEVDRRTCRKDLAADEVEAWKARHDVVKVEAMPSLRPLRRLRGAFSAGDVAAARLALRRAAERDDPRAALALGELTIPPC